ncbi:E4 ORFB [Human adenovirus 5]|nr:E4 ORFB [Human adenovirus 5]
MFERKMVSFSVVVPELTCLYRMSMTTMCLLFCARLCLIF